MTKEQQIEELAEITQPVILKYAPEYEDEASCLYNFKQELSQAILSAGYTKSPEIKLTLTNQKKVDKIMSRFAYITKPTEKAVFKDGYLQGCISQLSHNEQEVERQLRK